MERIGKQRTSQKKLAQEEKKSLGENFRRNIKTNKLTLDEIKNKEVLMKKEEQLTKLFNLNETTKVNICELKLNLKR